jgi:hypothetical protein
MTTALAKARPGGQKFMACFALNRYNPQLPNIFTQPGLYAGKK